MKLRHRKKPDKPHVNLTPLIDTVFLLLIFFMMTTTFNKESQLNINLPEAKSESITKQQPLRIIVNAKGEFAINDLEHSLVNTKLETLKRALKAAASKESKPALLISADAKAPHHAVMRAMEAARDLGFVHVSFEAQQRPVVAE